MIDEIASHFGTLDFVKSTEIQGTKVVAIVDINNESFSLEIEINSNFPNDLPDVHLLEPAKYGLLPHVCWKGKVCYNDGEGVSIDTSQPVKVAEYALSKAITALSTSVDEREDEFFNEFEGYWNQQETGVSYCFFEPSVKLQILKAPVKKKSKIPTAFFPNDKNLSINNEYAFARICKKNLTEMNAIYLPLERYIDPPLPGDCIEIDFLSKILESLSVANKALWEELLVKKKIPKDALHILISHPRPKGGRSLYGVTIPHGLNWINGDIQFYNFKITPLFIVRHTPDHMIQRSGGNVDISDKSIVILGCGSIGGRVAELLVMCGIKKLMLIDSDIFSSDNLFRHVLDSRYIGWKKVDSLADQLKSRFPYISIKAKDAKVSGLSESMLNHDAIIDVTGNPTLGRELNLAHRNLDREVPPFLLTAWTEPLGLGGHATISDGKTMGCLHCLYYWDHTEQLSSIFSFVKENQEISRNLTGCGGAFTPFNALDAGKTAEMTARMVIDALSFRDLKYKYQWWRGGNEAAIEANIVTTQWYLNCEHDVKSQTDEVFNEGCLVCRKK